MTSKTTFWNFTGILHTGPSIIDYNTFHTFKYLAFKSISHSKYLSYVFGTQAVKLKRSGHKNQECLVSEIRYLYLLTSCVCYWTFERNLAASLLLRVMYLATRLTNVHVIYAVRIMSANKLAYRLAVHYRKHFEHLQPCIKCSSVLWVRFQDFCSGK